MIKKDNIFIPVIIASLVTIIIFMILSLKVQGLYINELISKTEYLVTSVTKTDSLLNKIVVDFNTEVKQLSGLNSKVLALEKAMFDLNAALENKYKRAESNISKEMDTASILEKKINDLEKKVRDLKNDF